ncbi:MAG TPA: membrane dipeptidase [Terriglobia bacterium]|nr:membrane dipeptidase [Terriglobia bacterium]
MIVIDSHLDLSWNALNWGRDLTLPVEEIRRTEAGMHEYRRGQNTVSFPAMRKGEVAISLATVLARASSLKDPQIDYPNQQIASAMARGQRAYYRIMEDAGQMRMLRKPQDLEAHMAEWQSSAKASAPLGYILSMEGADPILDPKDVFQWWEDGLRVVGLAHYGVSAYAHGTGTTGGLTARGVELLKAMDEVGMILDVTHLADDAFSQVVEHFQLPVLASHSNCRALVPNQRQLSDDQIRRLIERDSVIGSAFDCWMLLPDYVPEKTPNTQIKIETVVNHIDHVCQIAGTARHAAIGSDLDGGFGREQSPSDLDTIADLQRVAEILRARGYAEPDIEGVMHGNWIRFFKKAWGAAGGGV